MSYEVILERLNKMNINNRINNENSQDEIYHFLKYSYKYKIHKDFDNKIENMEDNFNEIFPFSENRDINIFRKVKVKEFCIEWFRKKLEYKRQDKYKWQINNLKSINTISGIYTEDDSFQDYINKLIPGSFGLLYNFVLTSPYFSKDDDEFYIIDNPVMKEKVWKVPMIKGSSWKGSLLQAALRKMSDLIEIGDVKKVLDYYLAITRIFGTGSDDFRKIEDEIKKFINGKSKEDNGSKIINQLIKYALNELGLNIKITKNGQTLAAQVCEQIISQNTKSLNRVYENLFTVRKGRAVFYPTYFDKLSLEVINPHNRNTKAGTHPIYYEVVPSVSKGILQIVYIPYDSITVPIEELKKQVQKDCNFLKELVKMVLEEIGIGAKTKLGWGRATIKEKRSCFANMEGICGEKIKAR